MAEEETVEEAGPTGERTRLYVLAVLAVGLLVGVLVVVLAGSGGGDDADTADAACVEEWNNDQTMVAFGQHQFGGHGYERVEVLRVSEEGVPTDSDSGLCAVVFAATALDPEPGARAQVQLDGTWTGFESLGKVTEAQIGKLQSDATAAVNASLTADGRIVTVSSS